MAQVAGDSRVVAVTTAGETKTKLRPQVQREQEGGMSRAAVGRVWVCL